jgi:hypothetical protein
VQKAGSTRLFTGMERYLADALSKSRSDRQFDRIHSMATAEPLEFDLAGGASRMSDWPSTASRTGSLIRISPPSACPATRGRRYHCPIMA